VRSDGVGSLAGGKIDGDGDDRLRCDRELERIRDGECAIWDDDGTVAAESKSLKRIGVDERRASLVVAATCNRVSDGSLGDGQVSQSESIGNADPDLLCTNGHVQSLANRRVCENEARLVLSIWLAAGYSYDKRLKRHTNGGGGRFAGSVN
jgi:hypothetical protein